MKSETVCGIQKKTNLCVVKLRCHGIRNCKQIRKGKRIPPTIADSAFILRNPLMFVGKLEQITMLPRCKINGKTYLTKKVTLQAFEHGIERNFLNGNQYFLSKFKTCLWVQVTYRHELLRQTNA